MSKINLQLSEKEAALLLSLICLSYAPVSKAAVQALIGKIETARAAVPK